MRNKRMKISAVLFVSAVVTELIAATETQHLTAATAIKDFTVAGLLLAAVGFLYRELSRERQKSEQATASLQSFIVEQSARMQEASEAQSEALDRVAKAMSDLQNASVQQVAIYREHINALVAAATKK
jgi:choline-glycine betaine transporter